MTTPLITAQSATPELPIPVVLPAWVVRKTNRANLLEDELLLLHKEGFFIYKVLCNPATGDYVIIAKPRRHYNGKLKELNRIRKAITAFVEMMKRADQS